MIKSTKVKGKINGIKNVWHGLHGLTRRKNLIVGTRRREGGQVGNNAINKELRSKRATESLFRGAV